MLYGFLGKMLFVDLSDGSMYERELTEELARDFLGGYGIGAKILYELMPPGTDPLGPDSVLGFVTGPAAGTKAFFGGRYTLVFKSPVYNAWGDANSGGFFGAMLKKAGYDALFVRGIAEKPVYISIIEGQVEIKDATHLWGLDSKQTWEALKEETGISKIRVNCLGPAGENCAYLSCPMNDGHRTAGRGGGGAVMGSKKLKAIAVYGTKEIPVADEKTIFSLNRILKDSYARSAVAKVKSTVGTAGSPPASAMSGDSPVKNWTGVGSIDYSKEFAAKLGSQVMDPKYKVKSYHCSNCPLGCGAEYKVENTRYHIGITDRPEYETLAGFGVLVLCDDAEAALKCNDICNTYGLDTIGVVGTVGWAMECCSRGILSREQLDGIDLVWGNAEAMVQITEKLAKGEGCGRILMNGSKYASDYWGVGAECLVVASGMELSMHDIRCNPGLGRVYQYDPAPGRHVKGGISTLHYGAASPMFVNKYDYRGTGYVDLRMAINSEIVFSGGFCKFMGAFISPDLKGEFAAAAPTFQKYLTAITGYQYTEKHAYEVGLRNYLIRQSFNIREGFTYDKMTISDRAVGKPPLTTGPCANGTIDTKRLGENFAAWLGVDETGKPRLEVLKMLGGMDEQIRDFYGEDALAAPVEAPDEAESAG